MPHTQDHNTRGEGTETTPFDSFIAVASSCADYIVERMFMSRIEEVDALDIGLVWGPGAPDITLSFRNLYYVEIRNVPGPGANPLFEVATTVLEPSDGPWPDGLGVDLVRSSSLPPLLWFRAAGGVRLNVLATGATAYVQPD